MNVFLNPSIDWIMWTFHLHLLMLLLSSSDFILTMNKSEYFKRLKERFIRYCAKTDKTIWSQPIKGALLSNDINLHLLSCKDRNVISRRSNSLLFHA